MTKVLKDMIVFFVQIIRNTLGFLIESIGKYSFRESESSKLRALIDKTKKKFNDDEHVEILKELEAIHDKVRDFKIFRKLLSTKNDYVYFWGICYTVSYGMLLLVVYNLVYDFFSWKFIL